MRLFAVTLTTIIVATNSCKKPEAVVDTVLKIDSSVVFSAKAEFRYEDTAKYQLLPLSRVFVEYYSNDLLGLNDFPSPYFDTWGKYKWEHDTLWISSSIGDVAVTGFIAKIREGKVVEFLHSRCSSHGRKIFKPFKDFTATDFVLVPCASSSLTLSQIPDENKKEIITGYVEFKSKEYYCHCDGDDPKRVFRQHVNMKYYFQAEYER